MFDDSQQLCQKSSASPKGSCPHASSYKNSQSAATKPYTVNFESLSLKNFCGKAVALVKKICSRVSPSSIKSAWYIGTQNDLSQPFLRSWKSGSYVSEFATPAIFDSNYRGHIRS